MKPFAALIESLVFAPARTAKTRLLIDYFAHAPDPDRGYALAALAGTLSFPGVKAGTIRGLAEDRVAPELFRWSYDFVGDLAETVSLIWPAAPDADGAPRLAPRLAEVVERMRTLSRSEAPAVLARWLDAMEPSERLALIKLVTGGLRIGVSARLAKTALAEWAEIEIAEIEAVWHGLEPPYEGLFAWLERRGPRPEIDPAATFHPLMLAVPLEEAEVGGFDIASFRAEWKWDGIRVQLGAGGERPRIYSRAADEITASFPEIAEAMTFDAVLDGELLVVVDGEVRPFNDLQQRLNRKTVTAAMLAQFPAWVRLYDILFEGAEDLRGLGFDARRARLEAWYAAVGPARMDLSPLIPFEGWADLAARRDGARADAIEGLMLKRGDSPYLAGRPKGHWFKWKRDPMTLDCVLMYAQRGHGKRSSFYSDYTFGAWRDGAGEPELVPVGKAYFGFTDEELVLLDRWIRAHTVQSFGPVREVEKRLVFEVAFDSVHRSPRHKSGVAMRFPRIRRIRWDKPAAEADRLDTLERLIVE